MAKEVRSADEHTAEEEDNRGSAASPTHNVTVNVPPNASTGVDAAIGWLRKGSKIAPFLDVYRRYHERTGKMYMRWGLNTCRRIALGLCFVLDMMVKVIIVWVVFYLLFSVLHIDPSGVVPHIRIPGENPWFEWPSR